VSAFAELHAWFEAGGPLMPAILALALALHALCLQRIVAAARGGDPRVGLGLIHALVAALPLLGLLGSVGGIIRTFDLAAGGARPGAAALGVGEALIATELALAAAVPGLLAHGWLSSRKRRAAP
jgi:biopolymer transport protein ExbB/TolQ